MEGVIECNPHKEVRTAGKLKPAAKAIPLSKEEGLELEALFVAGDANQDGVLTFSEFREILRTADSTVSHQIALRMFRETLCFMPDGGDSISPFAFATVAHAHGIKAPPAVVFNLLKKTWLQIQDDINPEKMKDDEQKHNAEELKDAIEETLKSQTDPALGVQNFRKFVLTFCGGKGESQGPPSAEEGADDESE
ncbi:hypothetical protein BDL97_10G083600 [Sphagnum fallax]|nr:hypothetical protein BDL97_10G083600 [Sphagnum fallax]